MTAPYLPPIKSVEGITLREALTYERTVDDGEEVPPPGRPPETPDDSMAVVAGGWQIAIVAQVAVETQLSPAGEDWRDARGRTLIRLVANVHAAGATTARLVAKFTTSETASSSNPALWTHAGAFGAEVPLELWATGPKRSSDWIPLHETAQLNDARWQVFAVGGDGVETPVVSDVQIQWRTAPSAVMEDLYWRELAPAAAPDEWTGDELDSSSTIEEQTAYTGLALTTPPLELAVSPFSVGWTFCDPPTDVEAYPTPTPTTVMTVPGLLSPTKSTSDVGVTGVTPTAPGALVHKDAFGPVKRFVGRPLAAQSVPAFGYEHWFTSHVFSGVATGTVASRLWVWRPGVGRVVLDADEGRFAQSTSGGAAQKYVLSVGRQCRNWGTFPAFEAEEGDRFVLDVWSYVKVDCGFADSPQGFGAMVGYNGTTVFNDPEGLAEFAGAASRTRMPRLRYVSDA